MGIVSKMKKRLKLSKEYDIKDLAKNIDIHAVVYVYPGEVLVTPSSDKKYWEIINTLNKLNIGYETFTDRGERAIKIIIRHKHHKEALEDEESDIFNSEGGFEI
jgi:uncharacterized DUF497 family protein